MIKLEIGGNTVDIPFDGKTILGIGAALALVVGGLTSFYQVEAEEEAVVMRFGKYIKTEQPGLRFKIPFGVDTVEPIAVRRQLKQEFGFATSGATNQSQWAGPREQEQEKQMVTGDLNAALVEWVIQYRIDDPTLYLFNVRNADETLRDASESVMREVVGDRTVDEVITIGRQEIESECLAKLQDLANKYEMGININQVQLKNVNPPLPVQSSFNEVNQAQQEREKSINVANGQYNREVPKASGEAEKEISEAEGYATERINEAEGDATRFNALYTEYQKAPDVTKRRIYLETLQEVIPQLGKKIIIDEDAKQILPLLQLGAESGNGGGAKKATK
ncbi:MAG: FtsH protease activity modulator HflK [Verrucomicrobiae bacterium]|nr:FtsH protease activity modulator HflK [Verrucomicrobiae bacterium]